MARVEVAGDRVAQIEAGILALVGIEKGDGLPQCERMFERLVGYRIFPDEENRMNLSVRDIQGGLLLVPQFTLAADTSSGMRPGFSTAAQPKDAESIFARLCEYASSNYAFVSKGIFAADMHIHLVNVGPVTFHLRCPPSL